MDGVTKATANVVDIVVDVVLHFFRGLDCNGLYTFSDIFKFPLQCSVPLTSRKSLTINSCNQNKIGEDSINDKGQ